MAVEGLRERDAAIAAADGTCPRCGAAREPDHRYCLDCGLSLPTVDGRLPSLRRRWIRRLGWYPGDWVWAALATLAVAVAGAAVAIAVTERRAGATPHVYRARATPLAAPAPAPPTTTRAAAGTPGPAAASPTNGRFPWPRGVEGWTIVLVSYPQQNGRAAARRTAERAASHGLNEVGILDSSLYASLQPGYLVVFTGVYPSQDDADAAVRTARQAGFAGAYSRQISR